MKLVIIGGTGLIGSMLVTRLKEHGHEAVPAAPNTGVNTLTGEGLAEALQGASVVVDVSNSPSFEDKAVMEFFQASGRNLIAAEKAAHVGHHVALSVVGTDRLLDSGYFRAKMAQEELIRASPIPHTILRSTQFFEFIGRIAQSSDDGRSVRVSSALIQPSVSDEVAAALADLATAAPRNDIIEIAGPEQFHLDDIVRRAMRNNQDAREVITDDHAPYFGAELSNDTLTPDEEEAIIAVTTFGDWLKRSNATRPSVRSAASASPPRAR
jgi:uncharacterized protein YbjT (DUF2867 family)